ncbi:MAG: hypothetical protein LBR89_00995 [Holosporales bacterium]|jgi:hypothetical protein|nr:hypothetical protein [Holosporales bacterium]
MTIKSLGMCIAIAACTQCVQGCSIQSQFDRLHLDYTHSPLERANMFNALTEIQDSLPEGKVALVLHNGRQLASFATIRPRDESMLGLGGRDVVYIRSNEVLPFVKANYRKKCSNPSEGHDSHVALY